ncbi:hypothetical protein ACLKA7_005520 [Drosophila subpalustris]
MRDAEARILGVLNDKLSGITGELDQMAQRLQQLERDVGDVGVEGARGEFGSEIVGQNRKRCQCKCSTNPWHTATRGRKSKNTLSLFVLLSALNSTTENQVLTG